MKHDEIFSIFINDYQLIIVYGIYPLFSCFPPILLVFHPVQPRVQVIEQQGM